MPEPYPELERLEPRYHVPRSQVWQGSRGAQAGRVHLHVIGFLKAGRLERAHGQALCSKKYGWYERPPTPLEELCGDCKRIAERHSLEIPELEEAIA